MELFIMKELAHGKLLRVNLLDNPERISLLLGDGTKNIHLSIPVILLHSELILVEENLNLNNVSVRLQAWSVYNNRLAIVNDPDGILMLLSYGEAIEFLQKLLNNKKER